MTIEELQHTWQNMQVTPKSQEELREILHRAQKSRLRPFEKKEIRQMLLQLTVLAVLTVVFEFYKDWSTGILIPVAVLEILDEFVGVSFMRWMPQLDSIEDTFNSAIRKLKRARLVSWFVHGALWLAVAVLAIAKFNSGLWSTVLLVVVAVPVVYGLIRWSSRKWSKKLEEVEAQLKDFLQEEEEMPLGA